MTPDPNHFQLFLLMFAIQALFAVGVAVVGFLIKRNIGQVDINFRELKESLKERADTNSRRIDVLDSEMEKIKVERGFEREYFAKNYVGKDDFIRDIRALDFKIDNVATDVKKLLVLSGRRDENAQV